MSCAAGKLSGGFWDHWAGATQVLAHTSFSPERYAERLVHGDDLMTELIKNNGKVNGTVEYLGGICSARWRSAIPPARRGS